MRFPDALPAERRAAVERLLRETDLTAAEIAARTGTNPSTVRTWNARSGQSRPPRRRRRWDGPEFWPEPRRAAVARLLREPHNDPGDVAEAAGLGRDAACRLRPACGLAPDPAVDGCGVPSGDARPEPGPHSAPLDAASVADAPTLRAHLRAHIARQIAAFDAALKGEDAAVLDSARVLRDLGGLKRLFDEVAGDRSAAGEGGDGGTGSGLADLPALRAEIARRYARFVGVREAA